MMLVIFIRLGKKVFSYQSWHYNLLFLLLEDYIQYALFYLSCSQMITQKAYSLPENLDKSVDLL